MTATPAVRIRCDMRPRGETRCQAEHLSVGGDEVSARRRAVALGWSCTPLRRDLCPTHAPIRQGDAR